MQYKDGTKAELGDIVQGPGFNLPYPAQGVVIWLGDDEGDDCSIHITTTIGGARPTVFEEHGKCEKFSLVYRADP